MKKILLIEDDPFLVDIYSIKLKESGYDVIVAEEGEAGLKKIKEESPDLVLLDIVLPNFNGWEILRKVDTKNVKIVVLSNLGEKDEVEKGIKLGAVKYLVKAHYTPTEVVAEVKKILK
jgi:DNA-binding response OmpR family regulator